MTKCRPEINDDLIRMVKVQFPETAMMGIAETIEWAIKRVLEEKRGKQQ